jgi:hypothetical protein
MLLIWILVFFFLVIWLGAVMKKIISRYNGDEVKVFTNRFLILSFFTGLTFCLGVFGTIHINGKFNDQIASIDKQARITVNNINYGNEDLVKDLKNYTSIARRGVKDRQYALSNAVDYTKRYDIEIHGHDIVLKFKFFRSNINPTLYLVRGGSQDQPM